MALASPGFAQTATPWSVTGSQQLLSIPGAFYDSTSISPAADVYIYGPPSVGGFAFPTPTVTLGDTSSPQVNYIEKIDSAGKVIYTLALHGTYLISIAFDSASNVYVAGAATGGFSTTPGAFLTTPPGDRAIFVCRLRGADGSPQYCTYLNAMGDPDGLAVDSAGDVIVVAAGVEGASPTPGAINLGSQIYVAKLNPAASALIYGATFGPAYQADPMAMAVDAAGNVVIAGITSSGAFPVTPNAVVPTFQPRNSNSASFITALNSTGTALLYSTFGNPGEQPLSIALSPAAEPELAEESASQQIFIRRYNGDASAVIFETPLNADASFLSPIAVDSAGITTLLSATDSINLPAVQPIGSCAVDNAGYLVRLDRAGNVIQSSFLPNLNSPGFYGINAGTDSVTAAVWHSPQPAVQELRLITLTPQPNAAVALSCAGNGATFRNAPLAPGEIISIFGSGIGPAAPVIAQPASGGNFPTQIADTELTFNGVPAPLIYVSSTQINAVTPFNLSTTEVTQMCVTYAGQTSNCMPIQANAAAPGIFRYPGTAGYAVALNQDGTINSQRNPAPVGSIVSLYVTGLGAVTPAVPDGSIVGLPLPQQDLSVAVMVPSGNFDDEIGVPADVLYAGPAPFEIAGFSQINVRVPPTGGYFTLTVTLPNQQQVSDFGAIWTQ